MKKKQFEKGLLRLFLLPTISILPFLLKKPPIKDWVIVYLLNGLTNGIIDKFLSSYKIIQYPVRYFANVFKINILFDFLLYPTITVYYNQITKNDNIFAIAYKLLFIIIPMFLIELWAKKRTNLIKWNKWWKWYHTIISLTVKSLVTRAFIEAIRKIEHKQKNKQKL